MKMNRQKGLAILLIFFGALILLNKFGVHTGHLFGHIAGWLFPAAMVALGYLGLVNGRRTIGWVLIVFGGLILLGKLSGLIGIAIAVGLIVFGISMLRSKSFL